MALRCPECLSDKVEVHYFGFRSKPDDRAECYKCGSYFSKKDLLTEDESRKRLIVVLEKENL